MLSANLATAIRKRGIVNKQLNKPKKVVLAYSGGLDTSIIIPWLKENYGCEVIAGIGDLGKQEDLEAARKKALATGASSAHVEDLREEFVRDYIWPTLRAGAIYEHTYLLGTSMARPVIAKRQAEIALALGADGLSHGCTGKGNDQVRFELAYKAIAPSIQIIAPWREWDIDSREDAIAYAQKHNVPVEQSRKTFTAETETFGISATKAANSKILRTRPTKRCGSGSFPRKKLRPRPKKSKSDLN